MAGKATIPPSFHETIRRLYDQGMGVKAIAADLECSTYTVRKAIDPEFVERERARQNALWPARHESRRCDQNYIAYQEAYARTPERREQVRRQMASLRRTRKAGDDPGDAS